MGKKTPHRQLLLLCLSVLVCRSTSLVFWTAVVELSYANSNNETVDKDCECGVYGRNSVVDKASGIVTLPRGDLKGCGPDPVYNRNFSSPPWIALVKRGNCTFSEKINAAKRQGAAAVMVYNVEGSGNSTTHMAHPEADDIVAVMVGNIQGLEIVRLIQNGTEVQLVIDVGSPHGPWMDTYWLYFLSIAFFIVTAASIAYFVFISANRLYNMNRQRRTERKMKSEAKKAIGRLQVRTLRRGDEEITSDSHLCAVCIESYKQGDVVTVLTCDHVFHKSCIEPWLLDRRTCPMCKSDILKSLGVEDDAKETESIVPPPDVAVITVAGAEPLYEVPLNDTGSRNSGHHPHHYDNVAFEQDSETARA